jgi:hypothetical protein
MRMSVRNLDGRVIFNAGVLNSVGPHIAAAANQCDLPAFDATI